MLHVWTLIDKKKKIILNTVYTCTLEVNRLFLNINVTLMMMMIHSISSAPFICENHIQRRLAPQIVIINFTFAGKGVF